MRKWICLFWVNQGAPLTTTANGIETLEKGVKKYKIYSKLTINTVECHCSDIVANFERISRLFLVLLLFTLNR